MNKTAQIIFAEIDEAINECISKVPKSWNESKFRKLYKKIKEK